MKYQVLLYYSYTAIADPEGLAARQCTLCQSLDLKGRLIIASEGINGTLEGTVEQTEAYIECSITEPDFKDIVYKKSEGTGSAFPRLSVRARSEIVSAHLGDQDINPTRTTGMYLQPDELHRWIHSEKEFYIVDMRNDYEHAAGYFAGSILPPIRNFRQLPEVLPLIEHLKGKTVVTVCTGGVRCEKASGLLVENGFSDVYQLYGGIVTYMERYPNQDFLGSLYVFDGRVTMAFNGPGSRTVVGACEWCEKPSERYVNCSDDSCHRHFICCEGCTKGVQVYCSATCLPKNTV